MAKNEVRIIGGQWKGRKLKFPARPDLRPTLGRVRETLFNWLAPFINDAHCLDLYAGSGALGFEALSRGAAEVTFVERDRKAGATLKHNAALLDARRAIIRNETARRFLDRTEQHFDLVFFDPPFSDQSSQALVQQLVDQRLTSTGLLYLEAPKRSPLPVIEHLLPLKQSTAGDCQFALLQRVEQVES